MDLAQFTMSTSILLCLFGILLISKSKKIEHLIKDFPRSKSSAIVLLSIGVCWFLFRHVNNLGEADFGEYKFVIGAIGICIAITSYLFIPDFLAVRALCILSLFYSREALDSAFLQEPSSRLFLVSIIYFIIVFSLYFGAWPYRFRDFLNWLFSITKRKYFLGSFFLLYSLILLFAKSSY